MQRTRRNTLPQDLPFMKIIVEMFLNNQMTEAEKACDRREGIEDQRLYVRTAASLMRSMRALMSSENDDIIDAQTMVQDTLNLADQNRLAVSWTSRLTSFPFNTALSNARRMTTEQLHAELVYGENLLMKVILEWVSGNWTFSFREALNFRSIAAIYLPLNAFLEEYDEELKAGTARTSQAESVDDDFRSGVYLGVGVCLLAFSVIPKHVIGFKFLMGFRGDRHEALRLLRKAGGWGTEMGGPDHTQRVPRISRERGGARRPLCDLVLVIFHLVISGFTREGVDVQEAENILEWNLQQYPDSIFFLFGKGRLHVMRSEPDRAIEVYKAAKAKIVNQQGYEQLVSVMLWEMALRHLALGQWRESAECWGEMKETAKWSKAVYAYGRAACLLQAGDLSQEEINEADDLMKQVPNLLQRIAGKSIPLEKFVARKAKRYLEEKKLVAPALELAYMLEATNRTTGSALAKHASFLKNPKLSVGEDDRQLVNLLLAATYRHIDFPNSEDIIAPSEKEKHRLNFAEFTPKTHEKQTIKLLMEAKDSGPKLKQEYWVAYFAHYELGRLYEELGRYSDARQCFTTVASGSSLEGPTNTRRGKYSLQNAIMLRASSSIATLPPIPQNRPRPVKSNSIPGAFTGSEARARPRPVKSNAIPGAFVKNDGYEEFKQGADVEQQETWRKQEAQGKEGHEKRGAVRSRKLEEEAMGREEEGGKGMMEPGHKPVKTGDKREEEVTQEKEEEVERQLLQVSALPVEISNGPNSAQQTGVSANNGPPCSSLNQPFYPVDNDRPRLLSFAQFDEELLSNIQDLNVPVLQNALWRSNSDGELYGGFGYVERATWNNQDIAVKFLRGTRSESGIIRGKRSFRRELVAWSKLSHPNILPFLGIVCVDNQYLGMASPYMPNGSSRKYITNNPEANVLQILYDVAAGLSHLADQRPPIAHGDLKGVNVLISQDGRARICDFGLSRFMKDFMSIDTALGGTIRWMAPEQLLSETMMVSLSADIFSWGMLALELMTGSIPWQEVQQDVAVVIKVATHNQRPDRPTCDDALWELIQQCWLRDPNERPTAAQICEALAQEPIVEPYAGSSEI